MGKYAQYSKETRQMIGTPQNLPSSFTTQSGSIISGFQQLSDDVLLVIGWAPVVYEDLPNTEAYHWSSVPFWDTENSRFVFEAVANDIDEVQVACELAIDESASNACARYLSTGTAQELRYSEKALELALYQSSGNQEDCPVITAEAERCGVTFEEKLVEITATRAQWVSLCAAIEAERIGGKRACLALTDAIEKLAQRDASVAILNSI